jgi:hypothetical protein
MSEFGQQLRKFRHRCNETESPHGKLTQEHFGELVGTELGINGYTGAAVSDWELGKTRIQADDRGLLMALIKVLHVHGGIRTVKDANQLLKAGNFRDVDTTEEEKIFTSTTTSETDAEQKELLAVSQQVQATVLEDDGGSQVDPAQRTVQEVDFSSNLLTHPEKPNPGQKTSKPSFFSFLGNLLFIPADELQELMGKVEEGPSPSWPRKLAWFMRKGAERWSLSTSSVFWMAAWALAWWLIPPSLRWPFLDQSYAFSAMVMYTGGTLAVPLLIGLLVKTKDSEYWKQHDLAGSKLLRLYTYQGAAIGFNLGYFFVFPFVLVSYYLQLGSSIWLELVAVTLGLILGNMGARVVPHNLWLAYHRLLFRDGYIFFVAAFVGPLWAIFFLEFYALLLTPAWGSTIFLIALLLVIRITVQQSRKKTDIEQAQP